MTLVAGSGAGLATQGVVSTGVSSGANFVVDTATDHIPAAEWLLGDWL